MKGLLPIIATLSMLALSANAAESRITSERAIEKLHEFFGLLDIRIYDKENLSWSDILTKTKVIKTN